MRRQNRERVRQTRRMVHLVCAALLIAVPAISAFAADDGAPSRPKKARSSLGVEVVDVAAVIGNSSLSAAEKSVQLTTLAEKLTTPTGFMFADKIYTQALALDASNLRAQFYKAMLATPMQTAGILTKLSQLSKTRVESQKVYDEILVNLPSGGLRSFLTAAAAPFKNEKDIQAFIDQTYQSQDRFRLFLKNNKAATFTLNVNYVQADIDEQKTILSDCSVVEIAQDQYQLSRCAQIHQVQVILNRADIETLQQMSAGIQIYMMMLSAYDLTGGIQVAQKYAGIPLKNWKQTTWKDLSQVSEFATLRTTNQLSALHDLGIDAVAGARYVIQVQGQLCPKKIGASQRGPRITMSKGACIPRNADEAAKFEQALRITELALAGQALDLKFGATSNTVGEYITQARPMAVVDSPVADLKSLSPQFDSCDNIASVSDRSAGGLLPRSDANQILGKVSSCVRKVRK